MGIVIEASAVSEDASEKSSIGHAARAAEACLARAGVAASDVNVIINVGVYRDDNLFEPAVAAILHKQLGGNLDYVKDATGKSTFSFDLMNGACGAINAVQASAAYLFDPRVSHVLVVSSDGHPSKGTPDGFPIARMGAAMLLGRDDAKRGFGRVRARLVSDVGGEPPVGDAAGYVDLTDKTGGRGRVTLDVHPEHRFRALEIGCEAAEAYIKEEKLDRARTLLVASDLYDDFGKDLARRVGLPAAAVVDTSARGGSSHSSAPLLGYERAKATLAKGGYDAILFVSTGAGLTSACTVYRT